MLPIPASIADYLAYILGAAFLFVAFIFMLNPKRGIEATQHREADLGVIMAGRFFFMVMMIVGAAALGTPEQLGFVFIGCAGMAFFDAATYFRTKGAPWGHFGGGVVFTIGALIALGGQA